MQLNRRGKSKIIEKKQYLSTREQRSGERGVGRDRTENFSILI